MARRTRDAFRWIIKILHKHNVPFQIAGGFAARIYGSHRLLADIDIGIHDNRLKEIVPEVRKYIIYGPQQYVDENFNLLLMTLKYKGQEIDIYGNDNTKLFDYKNKKWLSDKSDFKKSVAKNVYGLKVHVIPKQELIAYKTLLGREVDIADVKALTKH